MDGKLEVAISDALTQLNNYRDSLTEAIKLLEEVPDEDRNPDQEEELEGFHEILTNVDVAIDALEKVD